MKKICIITHSHLCRNPRVVKEAGSLSTAGYQVSVLTTWTDNALLSEDLTLIDTHKIRYIAAENIIPGQLNRWHRLRVRLTRRLAVELVRRFRLETVHALGYGFRRNLRKAVALKADLYICHQELPTAVGCRLIRKGFAVAFDFEDWYSRDLLPEARRGRPLRLLEKCEKYALRRGVFSYTISDSLAAQLARFADTGKPGVLYNAFPFSERDSMDGLRKDRIDPGRISLHWFSQTIGPGRGLEELSESLNGFDRPYELHLRGNCGEDYKNRLLASFQLKTGQQVLIHPLVSHRELLSRIGEHDVGLALEKNEPASRDLTITNKILQYLQAGLAVVASCTQGQAEVAKIAGKSLFLFNNAAPADLVSRLQELADDRERLEAAKAGAVEYTRNIFCWESEEKKLLSWVERIFASKS